MKRHETSKSFFEKDLFKVHEKNTKRKNKHIKVSKITKKNTSQTLSTKNVHVFFLGGVGRTPSKPKKQKKQIPQECFAMTGRSYDWGATAASLDTPFAEVANLEESTRVHERTVSQCHPPPPRNSGAWKRGLLNHWFFVRFLGSHDVDFCWFIWNIELIWFTWFSLIWPQRRMS